MMARDNTEAIGTYNLTKRYGRAIGVSNLNLSVEKGQVFGFLGPNGAGKTTTIRLLLGLIKPTSGDIWILGNQASASRRETANLVGYLPGDFGLYRDMTGYDYLRYLMKLRKGRAYKDLNARLEDLTNRFDISFYTRISTYSKGMKQVIGIIQAFMHDPRILILDEPTSGLDPILQERFYELLVDERSAGKTIFLSSHILGEVEKVCDRAAIIKRGKLITVLDADRYRSSPTKKLNVTPRGEVQEAMERLEELRGVTGIVAHNRSVEFLFSGQIQELLQCMSEIGIDDMVCEAPTLEDAFYAYY